MAGQFHRAGPTPDGQRVRTRPVRPGRKPREPCTLFYPPDIPVRCTRQAPGKEVAAKEAVAVPAPPLPAEVERAVQPPLPPDSSENPRSPRPVTPDPHAPDLPISPPLTPRDPVTMSPLEERRRLEADMEEQKVPFGGWSPTLQRRAQVLVPASAPAGRIRFGLPNGRRINIYRI